MRYIINKENKVIATIHSGSVSLEDLQSREERIVEGPDIELSNAHFKNGKIIEKIPVVIQTDKDKDDILISERIVRNAKNELKAEGKLKHYK